MPFFACVSFSASTRLTKPPLFHLITLHVLYTVRRISLQTRAQLQISQHAWYTNAFALSSFSQMPSNGHPLPLHILVLPTTMMTSPLKSTTPTTSGSVSCSSSRRLCATSPSGSGKRGNMVWWTPSSADSTLAWGLRRRRTRRRGFWLTTWFATWMYEFGFIYLFRVKTWYFPQKFK